MFPFMSCYLLFISFFELGFSLLSSLLVLLWILLLSSLFTVVERKLLASLHRRKGPSYLGYFGLLQIAADGVKLLFKDWNGLSLTRASSSTGGLLNLSSILAPLWMFVFGYLCFSVLFFDILFLVDFPYMFLFLFILGVFAHTGIILTGILTDSKWTVLGSIRACIVYISYDVVILLCWLLLLPEGFCSSIMSTGTLSSIVFSQSSVACSNIVRYPLLYLLMLFTILVEVGRIPSDLSEAESELVSGYNVEYGGFMYAMMASSEYASMVLGSMLLVLLFFGASSLITFSVGVVLMFSLFIMIRGTLPRLRYTDILKLYWCDLLPLFILTLSFYVLI
jgi:NADH:ubiquinone oxidoreductase subunit H